MARNAIQGSVYVALVVVIGAAALITVAEIATGGRRSTEEDVRTRKPYNNTLMMRWPSEAEAEGRPFRNKYETDCTSENEWVECRRLARDGLWGFFKEEDLRDAKESSGGMPAESTECRQTERLLCTLEYCSSEAAGVAACNGRELDLSYLESGGFVGQDCSSFDALLEYRDGLRSPEGLEQIRVALCDASRESNQMQ